MKLSSLITAAALFAGGSLATLPLAAPALAQAGDATCTTGTPCAKGGVPPAAPGGESGSAPSSLRNAQRDSPVGTGAGGGSSGGGENGAGGVSGSKGSGGAAK